MRDRSRILLSTTVLLLAIGNVVGSSARMAISNKVAKLEARVTQLEKQLETRVNSSSQDRSASKSVTTDPASNAAERTLFSKQADEDIESVIINWRTVGGGEISHELSIRIDDLAGDGPTEIGDNPFEPTVRALKSFGAFDQDSVLVGTVLANGKELGHFHVTIPELERGDIVINRGGDQITIVTSEGT